MKLCETKDIERNEVDRKGDRGAARPSSRRDCIIMAKTDNIRIRIAQAVDGRELF